MAFPGAGASVHYNDEGEPMWWDYPGLTDEPAYPEDFDPYEDDLDGDYDPDPGDHGPDDYSY